MRFNKIAVLGVGLRGGSFAMAMRAHALAGHITGYGRTAENIEKALKRGVIDSIATDPAEAVADADLVLLATPVGQFVTLAGLISRALKPGAIVTDAGSVKGALVGELETLMPEGVNFVGAHPIAGSERAGVDNAQEALFKEATCIITRTARTDEDAIRVVKELWLELGAQIREMTPDAHDRVYALVSHLPHAVAYALVNTVADADPAYLRLSGRGFKDATRIAMSHPDLWTEICMLNREHMIEAIAGLRLNLDRIEAHLRAGDSEALRAEFELARSMRVGLGN